jgi:hypothetical protein
MRHVRFTPNRDRESGFPREVMSALPPKADMCGATRDVRFGPIADIEAFRHRPIGQVASRGSGPEGALHRMRAGLEPPRFMDGKLAP